MIECPNCGFMNPSDALRCYYCEYDFEKPLVNTKKRGPMKCPNCGLMKPDNALIWVCDCGYDFEVHSVGMENAQPSNPDARPLSFLQNSLSTKNAQ